MQAGLLNAAKALDRNSPTDALSCLRKLPLLAGEETARLVALALWKRMVLSSGGGEPLRCKDSKMALSALNDLGAALTDEKYVLAAYRALPVLEKLIGSADAAAAVAAIFWDRILSTHEGVFVTAFELFFRGGDIPRCRQAWQQFLSVRKDYVPAYWSFLLYCRTQPSSNRSDIAAETARMIADTGREDLLPLTEVYLLQMQQADCREIRDAAGTLSEPAHRARAAEYTIGLGYTPEDLPIAVASFRELTSGPGQGDDADLGFMEARLANATRNWESVLVCAERAGPSAQYHQAAELLAAIALAHLGQIELARTKINQVAGAPDIPDYLRARSAFVSVTTELIAKGLPTPQFGPAPKFPDTPGRPLAQSLWVGNRLRWIERLAIRSYLDNGWRFQLYAYDDVENVPHGCEVLDASAIIPRKAVFREGFRSGLHAGSVGAFSDLFRYRLLYERGGMWTDTDVINLKRFDPDGSAFISTELSDAGLVTLNGAIMAAPAGQAFIGRAYERASELLRSDEMFFTRIGPYLLAELLVESGVESMALMPPNFLSAVFWMNAAHLLDPYDSFMQRLQKLDAVNLHAYTEMWRMLGLGLDRPPGPETFLGKLYVERFGEQGEGLEGSRP